MKNIFKTLFLTAALLLPAAANAQYSIDWHKVFGGGGTSTGGIYQISGANGINPGLTLKQQGVTEGGENVALSGRVYVLADASNGPIKPGDLLTTSSTPGHCMKVVNQAEAQGAILGKAMTSLESGRGFVLVLVTLQ